MFKLKPLVTTYRLALAGQMAADLSRSIRKNSPYLGASKQ